MEMINESDFICRRIHNVVNIGIGGSDLDPLWPTKRCGITTSTRYVAASFLAAARTTKKYASG
jgi:glucose-6-phosphate isomerase